MSTTLILLVGGCTLGVFQFLAGLALGLWFRRSAALQGQADLRRAQRLAANLQGLTQDLGQSVGEHQRAFSAVEARLTSEASTDHLPTTDMIVGVVGEILRANRQLQTELEQTRQQVVAQATEIEAYLTRSLTDPLTDLPNRRALDEYLTKRVEEYRQQGIPFSLLMIDLDHFKPINDNFGHPMGDSVLRETSRALREAVRRQDFVARYGGEEFAAVLPAADLEHSRRAAEKTLEAFSPVSEKFHYLGRPLTASCGLASILPGESVESLIRRADAALYEAKRCGRNVAYQHTGETATWLADGPEQLAWKTLEAPADATEPACDVPLSRELEHACQALRVALCDELGAVH
jgi:diguanylate cyclase (GGDEF)-like protein